MKLYLAYLGMYDDKYGMYELHISRHVVAESISDAKKRLKANIDFKERKMHIDGIQEINVIDGYLISIDKTDSDVDNNYYSHEDVKHNY
jgi:hypothetical protein